MKIVTIGRGHIGGGLGRPRQAAEHEADELDRDGRDVPAPARQGDSPSYVEEVKSFAGGPVAKSFNGSYAAL